MKTLILSALAAISFCALTSCAGYTVAFATPYGVASVTAPGAIQKAPIVEAAPVVVVPEPVKKAPVKKRVVRKKAPKIIAEK